MRHKEQKNKGRDREKRILSMYWKNLSISTDDGN